MTNAAQFYQAARPAPPRIIGLQLRPFSLGHHITLHAYGSSFITYDAPRYSDLILGIFICSQSWRSWEEWRLSWKLPIVLKLWGWCFRKFDVRSAGVKFTNYIEENSVKPEVVVSASSTSLVAPWELRLKLFLVQVLGLSNDEAMDYPLALAWQEYCAHGEVEGRINLLSEGDKATLAFRGSDEMHALVAEAKRQHQSELDMMKARAETQPAEEN